MCLYGIKSTFHFLWEKSLPSLFTNGFHLKSLFQSFLFLVGIQCLIYYFKAYFYGRLDLNILFRVFLASPSLHCQFIPHCLFGGWSRSLPPSYPFCDPLMLWKNNSGLPLHQSSSLYLSHDSVLCILGFIPSYLWETVKACVIFLSSLNQHSDTEAILYHSRWLTSQEISVRKTWQPYLHDCRKQRSSPFPLASTFVGYPIPYSGNLSSKLADRII